MKNDRYSIEIRPEIESYVSTFRDRMQSKNGCRLDEGEKTAIIYSPVLAALLFSEKFPAIDAGEKIIINGRQFRESYINGFIEGQDYFTRTYGSGDPYNQEFRADLIVQFNNIGHEGYEGWNFVKSSYPVIISNKIIKEWGYYAGIVSSYEDIIRKHPSIGIEDGRPLPKSGPRLRELALIAACKGDIITRDKGKVYLHFLHYSSPANRTGAEDTKKKSMNKVKLFEKIIPELSGSALATATENLKKLKENINNEWPNK